MKNDFKKIFFSSMLVVLFIISNLIGAKYTSFGNMIVSANFITYPFIILCILILLDHYNKKDTYNTIISAVFIQIFVLLSYSLVTKMNSQEIMPDLSTSINSVFSVNEVSLLVSLISFMLSNYAVINIFSFFKEKGKKFIGVVFGTISSLIIYGLIYIVICYYNIEKEIIINLILSHVFVSVIMSLVIVVLFYILRENSCIYTIDDKEVTNINIKDIKAINDKNILDVINMEETNNKKTINKSKNNVKTNKTKKESIKKTKTVKKNETIKRSRVNKNN